MTTNTTPRPVRYNRWDLETMLEAKAARDADGTVIEYLDENLARALAQFAEGAQDRSVETQLAEEFTRRPGNPNAATRGTANAPSEAQLNFIASLARSLGRELDTPRDKRHASLIIDQAKKELDKARREGTAAPRAERKATDRQVEFLSDLLNERDHTYGELDPAELPFSTASAMITQLMSAPRAKVAAHGIREGRYAYTPDGGQTADHYRVRRDGKIVVWTAGGEYPYTGKGLNEGLEWIKANPREAAALFGQLTETCGRCGRELSDDDSRKLGLGPVCAGKSEW
jgi:hypothetical protein